MNGSIGHRFSQINKFYCRVEFRYTYKHFIDGRADKQQLTEDKKNSV